MKKKVIVMALSCILTLSSALPVFAVEKPQIDESSQTLYNTAECLDDISALNDSKIGVQGMFGSYDVSSAVSRKGDSSLGYYASGWVNVTDKKTSKGLSHYTTAQMEFRGHNDSTVYATSGRQYGTGKVPANSDRTGILCGAYIYYGDIK